MSASAVEGDDNNDYSSSSNSGRDRLTVLIVTSPAPSHPSLFLLDKVIESLTNIRGAEQCRVVIVFDGYVVASVPRPKSGRVTAAMAEAYEENYRLAQTKYAPNIHAESTSRRFELVKSEVHLGFAMCVRWGLERHCPSPYALIVQHDRAFTRPFDSLCAVMDTMDSQSHIRYAGFPTVMSAAHEAVIRRRYHLDALLRDDMLVPVKQQQQQHASSWTLMPLIFWYDSNHLGHVQRYLEIFKPFTYVSDTIRMRFSAKQIKQMLLRQGDFIEDRFGQAQRNMLVDLGERVAGPEDEEALRNIFRWFGSYLVEAVADRGATALDATSSAPGPAPTLSIGPQEVPGWPAALEAVPSEAIYVSHLRGRTYIPDWKPRGGEEKEGEDEAWDEPPAQSHNCDEELDEEGSPSVLLVDTPETDVSL